MKRDHVNMPHDGLIIHNGKAGNKYNYVIEYSLKFDSNPLFTSSVLVAYARAANNYFFKQLINSN